MAPPATVAVYTAPSRIRPVAGIHVESERNQKGHGHGWAQPGRGPQDESAESADQQDQQIRKGKRLRKIVQEHLRHTV